MSQRKDDLEAQASAALDEARAIPHGPERSEAMKKAGTLRNAALDALATAVSKKIKALAATDPQIKAQTGQQLADLAKFQLPTQTISDMAGYWRTNKGKRSVPKLGLDLATKLAKWEKAAADPTDKAGLSNATYNVIDAPTGNRLAISKSSLSDADKAVLLRALDDLGTAVAGRMSSLVPH